MEVCVYVGGCIGRLSVSRTIISESPTCKMGSVFGWNFDINHHRPKLRGQAAEINAEKLVSVTFK